MSTIHQLGGVAESIEVIMRISSHDQHALILLAAKRRANSRIPVAPIAVAVGHSSRRPLTLNAVRGAHRS